LTSKYRLEKIKTIGDACIVTGEVSIASQESVEAVTAMALEMQKAIARMQQKFRNLLTICESMQLTSPLGWNHLEKWGRFR
jgi:uncharacterized coiled-coil protein SlyX